MCVSSFACDFCALTYSPLRYILGCMEEASLDNTKFVIPQIIQCLRHRESCETVEKVLTKAARKDAILAATSTGS